MTVIRGIKKNGGSFRLKPGYFRIFLPTFLGVFLTVGLLAGQEPNKPTPKKQEAFNPALMTPGSAPKATIDPKQYWKFFETEIKTVERNDIDKVVFAGLKKLNREPAPLCSDSVFVRRVYYDLTGGPPSFKDAYDFLRTNDKNKRAKLIDELLEKRDFADYWAMKWCDFLRVKAEFPINLWPNGAMVYYRWVHNALYTNMPYDQFARSLLLADGSNFRDPTANFYRALSPRTPEGTADAVARTFMGVRLASMSPDQRRGMVTMFSRIAIKKTAEWKEEVVYWDRTPLENSNITFPNGRSGKVGEDQDPREVFTDWLVKPNNSIFNFNIVNRIWYWLMSRGIVNEPDDFRASNPPVYPELLALLERELVEHQYDLRHIYRLIMNSHIYQQSSIARKDFTESEKYFAVFPIRRFDAEILQDTIIKIFGVRFTYKSEVPEPFTYIPAQIRTVMVYDSGITNEFLETFARASRDSGLTTDRINKTSQSQQLYFLNSTDMNNWTRRLIDQINGFLPKGGQSSPAAEQERLMNVIWMTLLSRMPTTAEQLTLRQIFGANRTWTRDDVHDIVWAVVNTKEFLCQH